MSDIKQHPLWREHHGDMTGYRFLEKDELPITGDEYIGEEEWMGPSQWVAQEHDSTSLIDSKTFTHRRRIAPATEAPKRFVTVVLSSEFPSLEYILVCAESYREGNYLEKFDGMKERVNSAMEDAK